LVNGVYLVDRLAKFGELLQSAREQPSLQIGSHVGNEDHEARMHGERCVFDAGRLSSAWVTLLALFGC